MDKVSYQKTTKFEIFGKCIFKLETVYNEQSEENINDIVEYYITDDYYNDEFKTDKKDD